MEDKSLKYLITNLEIVKARYDEIRDKKEMFNIFSAMYKQTDERRLHSRFIATLLNPFASHRAGSLFLRHFMEMFSDIDFSNFQNAIVYPDEIHKAERNNIDILIIDRMSRHAVIIENKIHAGDSNNENGGQLERYYKHIRDDEKIKGENIHVFYLTLDGHEPSDESLGEFKTLKNINGQCISYENHIIDWLNLCVKEVYNQPFIRESILQYKKLIIKMTNSNTSIEERKRIKDLIGKDEDSINATKYLFDNFHHVKWHTIADFWNELAEALNNNKLEVLNSVENKAITEITHYENNRNGENCGLSFKVNDKIEGFVWHEKDEYLFWGFEKDGMSDAQTKVFEQLEKNGEISESSSYWWNFCILSNGNKLWLKDFTYKETFDLISPEKREETISKIVRDILNFIEQHLS